MGRWIPHTATKIWDIAMPMGEIIGPQSRAKVGAGGGQLEHWKHARSLNKNKGLFSEFALTTILYKYTHVERERWRLCVLNMYIYIYTYIYIHIHNIYIYINIKHIHIHIHINIHIHVHIHIHIHIHKHIHIHIQIHIHIHMHIHMYIYMYAYAPPPPRTYTLHIIKRSPMRTCMRTNMLQPQPNPTGCSNIIFTKVKPYASTETAFISINV